MYRDSANALDEHDRAVGAILISEALIDECEKARARVGAPETPHRERWRTIGDVHATFPEVWRHLDRARTVLARRGAYTATYDELRPQVRRSATNADGDIDTTALDDARRAVENLKLAVPGADWVVIRKRTAGLVGAKLSRARGQRTILIAVVALFLTAVLAWTISIIPQHKVSRREAMRRELNDVVVQRKVRIAVTRFELGLNCDVERARELAKLLALDGRSGDAKTFGTEYIGRCGDDPVVDNWAHAPAPRRP
jgi:hypothetical protein